jgi:cardiolipin synthase
VTLLDQLLLAATVAAYGLGVIAALTAARRSHTAQGAAAWAVALIALPWLALPAYLAFGPPRFRPRAEGLADSRAAALARREDLPRARAPDGDDPERRRAPLERLAPLPALAAPRPDLLIDGEAIFAALFAAIDAAERYVFVQFYIVRDDDVGRALAGKLAAKARAGLRVLFLYDEVGARNAPERYWRELEAAGVETRAFSLSRRWPKISRINFRNHRKLAIADGRVAILGGVNLGDEYLGRSKAHGPWRDTAIRLEGPAAEAAEASFVEDWLWAGGAEPPPPAPPPDAPPPDSGPAPPAETPARPGAPVLILPTGPVDRAPACALAFLHAATAARKRLWIATPYFVPDVDMMQGLRLAALRGVDVRVLIPHRPDHRLVWLAAFAYADEALAAGVGLYRYEAGFLHQKVLLVDDWAAAVGTANLDNRSYRLNFELTAFVFDRAFAAEVAAMLEADFARSQPHGALYPEGPSLATRLLAPAARLFAPLL